MRLFEFEEGWARAVLGAMFPAEAPAGHAGPRGHEHEHGGEELYGPGFASIVRLAPFEAAVGLRLALLMVVLAPVVVLRSPRLFGSLAADVKERVLDGLLQSRFYAVRQLVLALKTMGALLYARDPVVRARLMTPKAPALLTLGVKKEASRAA